jgi:hypothetical protein
MVAVLINFPTSAREQYTDVGAGSSICQVKDGFFKK